jgi:hypothetical protein
MIHRSRRRNANEFGGAYGHETTFDEVQWLVNWLLVRGVNLLIPHAFYYSVRGPRRDERPPQLGPHAPWWDDFKPFADHCRRLCALNTDAAHVCDIAILTGPDHCPWRLAKALFQHQRDFNYLELDLLEHEATVDKRGVHLAGMHYRAVIDDGLPRLSSGVQQKLRTLARYDRLLDQHEPRPVLDALGDLCPPDVVCAAPTPGLRVRHVVKDEQHFYMLFNEAAQPIDTGLTVGAKGTPHWINTVTGDASPAEAPLQLALGPFEMKLLWVAS